jgi:hypothetical protein
VDERDRRNVATFTHAIRKTAPAAAKSSERTRSMPPATSGVSPVYGSTATGSASPRAPLTMPCARAADSPVRNRPIAHNVRLRPSVP